MHKTDAPGHFNNAFVPGDPITGTSPTRITAPWLNTIQEEIANVVTEAGIELDKNDNTQLLIAINALIDAKLANLTVTPPGNGESSVAGTSFSVNADSDLIYETDGQYAPLQDVEFSIQNDDLIATKANGTLPTMTINNDGQLEIDDANNS